MAAFLRITLRTSGVPAARAFYARVLGPRALDVVELHEQAVARGARPHWLGFLEVGDVDRAAAAFQARGATALGPKWVSPEGLEAAVMRDPGGAIVALARPPAGARPPDGGAMSAAPGVVWQVLNTADVGAARANYAELFGWAFGEPATLAGAGVFHPFAWTRGGPFVGSMGDIGGRPGVHPHWSFHLRVAALAPALEAVLSGGGTLVAELTLPTGERVAVCDDPQGATFAIRDGSVATPR
jgi:predicted enzyme related to lactoylglutathione lyase